MAIKVLLVDDHLVVLKGLRFFLQTQADIDIIGEAQNGKVALEKVRELHPDVVLMDLMMPEMNGVEATRLIKEYDPNIKVIILTSFSDKDYVLSGIKAGAEGYQLKDVDPDILVKSIRATMNGEKQLHPQVANQLMTYVVSEDQLKIGIHVLTSREQDVLCHITQGKSNREIASDLFVSEKTVKTHISHILAKLDVHDRTQAALFGIKNKWFEI